MCKFAKIVIDRKNREFRNIQFLPNIITLYEQNSKYLHDDYFLISDKNTVDAVINLVEKISPFFWVVLDKKDGKFAGFVFLDNLTGSGKNLHSAEVTTCFKPSFWGRYTKKCAQRFINYCFKKYGFKKMKALIFPQNLRVGGLLKKSGFKREAFFIAETIKNGQMQDIELYSIIRKD